MTRAKDANDREDLIDGLIRMILESRDVAHVLDHCRKRSGVGSAFLDLESGEWASGSVDEEFLERCRFFPLAEILRLYSNWHIESYGVSGYLIADSSFTEDSIFNKALSRIINAILLCRMAAGSIMPKLDKGRLLRRLIEAQDSDQEEMKHLEYTFHQECASSDQEFVMAAIFANISRADGSPADDHTKELFRRYERFLASIAPDTLCDSSRESFYIAVFREKRTDMEFVWSNIEEIFSNCARQAGVGYRFFGRGGIGGRGKGIADFAALHAQSELAVKYSIFERRGTFFCAWEDMGGARLFSQVSQTKVSRDAMEELRAFERAQKTPFFSTFATLVRNYWNLTATANELSLHYNSMKYRYDRIGEILNVNLNEEKNRFELSLVLRMYLYSLPMREFLEVVTI
jgi:hypothetical protein